jgi:hypothetical protein
VPDRAGSHTAFREVNERIAELTTLLDEAGLNVFVCECGDLGCAERLELTSAEYEAVRARGDRFAVRPGHERPDVERVVGGNGRFLVVEVGASRAAATVEGAPPVRV